MPEARFDPLARRWVLLAPERARRGAPEAAPEEPDDAPCDFCEGREQDTPEETYAVRPDGSPPDRPGWTVRVIPNLYPATRPHEVVVHTPRHTARFEDLEGDHRTEVFRAWRERLRAYDVECAVVAVNRGRQAGASRSHEHSQLFGLDLVPPAVAREAESLAVDPCLVCELFDDPDLVIDTSGDVRLVANPVPYVAHEVLVVPRCEPTLVEADDDLLAAGSDAVAAVLRRARQALGTVAFNLVFHTAPRGARRFHWHAHLYPRTATMGALEIGAELPIVAADPVLSARLFRGETDEAPGD